MNAKFIGVAVVLCGLAGQPAGADDGKSVNDIPDPDAKSPLAAWTPVQQGFGGSWASYGYNGALGALVLADELGDNISQLGRAKLIDVCLEWAKPDASAAAHWALCGPDAEALDPAKIDAELKAEGISTSERERVLRGKRETIERAKKIGEAVKAAAKDDPGVAAVLKRGELARAEWAAYARANQEAIARAAKLRDAVRSGKSNHKDFAGCYEATQPAFAALVRETLKKMPWQVDNDPLVTYVSYLVTTPGGYLTTAAYAACAVSLDKSGEALYEAAASTPALPLAGPHAYTLSKLLDETFKPKFAQRSLSLADMRRNFSTQSGFVRAPGVGQHTSIMTPQNNKVKAVKPDGETAEVVFQKYMADHCTGYANTNKISQIRADGTISYEQKCTGFTKVVNQSDPISTGTKFTRGLGKDIEVTTVYNFPVCAWKGNKWKAMLGVEIK